jgi:hypothetical protein
MKKLTLFKGRAAALLVLLCLFLAQGCRKDLLQPNSNVLKNSISVAEARKYFDANLRMANGPKKLMSTSTLGNNLTIEELIKNKQPLWDYAYNQLLSNGQAIKIPIDFGNAYAEVTKKGEGLLPLASLSYLYMYRDTLQNIHAEWVLLKPDSAWLYGNRSSYSGSISVKDWNGRSIRVYQYANGQVLPKISQLKKQRLSSLGKVQTSGDTEIPPTEPVDPAPFYCIRVSTGTCPKLSPCSNDFCDMCLAYCAKQFCAWPEGGVKNEPDLSPYDPDQRDHNNPDPAPGSTGGGGGPPPTTYPPTCESDPNYTVPDFPAPAGYDWVLPCSGAGGVPLPFDPGAADTNIISDVETVFDSESGATYAYGEIRQLFEDNPGLVNEFANESDLPIITVPYYSTFKTREAAQEYLALKYLHPNWSNVRAASTAVWNVMSGDLHFFLDVAGMFPLVGEPLDIINGGIYFIEGDNLNGALSVGAAIPIWGWTATGGKWIKNATKLVSKPIASATGKLAYRAIKTSRGGYRFVKVAVGAFSHSAISALHAIKPANNTFTNISRQLVDQMAHRISPVAQSLKSKIDNILLHPDLDGTATEAICDELFETGGFVKYDAKFGSNNGFDGVYIKKNAAGNVEKILINEAKQVGVMGNIKLNAANPRTGLAAQMSDAWISNVIAKMQLEGGAITALADLLNANKNNITKTVTGVERSSGEIIIVKLQNY